MDVQTENTDPPPNESQPSGKIRKGFKLFGKRKPGNIFSIRNKGDGNKSPVTRSKTLEGLSETDSQPDKEKGQELNQGEKEQAEDETLGEDGVLAAATARNSISSACSAKSLTFLSLLRGGKRGVGDRRVHTVSQPVGRQRRGLKGLFGNGKFRMKDKEDKKEAPPSPLLMSSRANSVEIIKEDLTLTPKCQPRALDSPEMDSCEPVQTPTAEDTAARSLPESLPVTPSNVSKRTEDVSPLPTSEPPLVPGDNSLSSLLADISSLLTFDSISGGGDIMADVEAEWGKASSAISTAVTHVSPSSSSYFSKSAISSLRTSTTVSTAATAKPVLSSTTTKPCTTITTFTTSSTSTSHSVKLSSDSAPTCDPSTSIKLKSTASPTSTKPSTTPTTLTGLSAPGKSSSSKTVQFTLSSTFATTAAPSNTSVSVVKASSGSGSLTSSASKLASEIASPPQNVASVSKPLPVTTSSPASANIPPTTHRPPITVAQPSPVKLDSGSILNQSTSYKPTQSSTVGESKAPETVSTTFTITAKPSPPASVILSKTTTVSTSSTASGSVFTTPSKPSITSAPLDLNKIPPTVVTVSALSPSSTLTTTTKTQPSTASAPPLYSASLDKIPPMTKPITAPISLDKMSPTPTLVPAAATHSASKVSPAPDALGQITLCQSSPAPAHIPISLSKEVASPALKEVSSSKIIPTPAEVPLSTTKDIPAPVKMQAVPSKEFFAPAHMAVSISKDPPVVSLSKAIAVPAQTPVSLSVDSPAPVCIQVPVSKAPHVPVQIPVSQIKAHPAPAISPPSPPAPLVREALDPAKTRGIEQASVDHHLARLGGTGGQGSQAPPSKTKEAQNEPQISLQESSKEKKPPQVKASGLSKIPIVGGGRAGKIPVRESQHHSEEPSREPTTPVQEERPHFNSHDAGSKDKIRTTESNAATAKHTQEESQQLHQPKVPTSSARDSKIPVKHGAQSHAVSQASQSKEPPRTKIPVSKVPVRKAGSKPAATGGTTQIRK